MAHLDLGDVVLRRMKEEDIEAVKALIKVCFVQKNNNHLVSFIDHT